MASRKKKHHEEGHVNHERWLITYADMITLLMVLFIVMFSMSRTDMAKHAALKASLQRAFDTTVLKGEEAPAVLPGGGALLPIPAMQEAMALTSTSGGPGADARMATALRDIRETLGGLPVPPDSSGRVEISAHREGIVISVSGNVLFDSGRSDLKPQGLAVLDALAERLRAMPNEVRVEGHTDNVPIATALYPSNWELASARATTVGRYLIEHGGVLPARMIAAGYGEHRPVATNDTREGRARNRRVDIVILFPQAPAAPLAGFTSPDRLPEDATAARPAAPTADRLAAERPATDPRGGAR
jgi:chemotaxis protein MotB